MQPQGQTRSTPTLKPCQYRPMLSSQDCCVLNGGSGAWAFQSLAGQLATAIGIEVSNEPRRFNYLLQSEEITGDSQIGSFIPLDALRLASDKRLLASCFQKYQVPTPRTWLTDSWEEALRFVREHKNKEWCLKYPTGCGAAGHKMLSAESTETSNWPRPFIIQEFIRLEHPEVYRTFCAGGEIFGWVARRYSSGGGTSPWVAHARGARYVRLEGPPPEVLHVAECALKAAGLVDSFGCVDLLRRPSGEWVALEVGTDGLFNHVDRELDDPALEAELLDRIAKAFWRAFSKLC